MNQPQVQPNTTAPAAQTLQLQDIHLPPEPGFWPPAPGWWLLAVIVIVALFFVTEKALTVLARRREQKQIEQTLQRLKEALHSDNPQDAITDINIFLRKMALSHFPHQEVAGLTGQAWLEFLDRSGNTRDFTQGPGVVLAEGPYRPALPEQFDPDALIRSVENWVRQVQKQQPESTPLYFSRQVRS